MFLPKGPLLKLVLCKTYSRWGNLAVPSLWNEKAKKRALGVSVNFPSLPFPKAKKVFCRRTTQLSKYAGGKGRTKVHRCKLAKFQKKKGGGSCTNGSWKPLGTTCRGLKAFCGFRGTHLKKETHTLKYILLHNNLLVFVANRTFQKRHIGWYLKRGTTRG